MILKRCVNVLGLFCFMLLSSCGLPVPPHGSAVFKVETPAERQAELAKIKFWQIRGAFSIQQEGKKSEIANYTWGQFDRQYRIDITSALDLYSVLILHEYGVVTLWKNSTYASTAKTPEKLMEKAIGWSLPVSELSDWIKGMPAKKAGKFEAQYDQYGHLITLRQKGWVLNYGRYKTSENDIDLPQVITLERPGLLAKIVIVDWELLTYRAPMPGVVM